jgi:hypothetical protein
VVSAALFSVPPAEPSRSGARLRQLVKAVSYWLGSVGRVVAPDDPVPAEPVPAEAVLDEPVLPLASEFLAAGLRPNWPMVLASDAGTPFCSRHRVKSVREVVALGVPLLGAPLDPVVGEVVVAPALALVAPPHALARTARAASGRRSRSTERFEREKRPIWCVTLNSSHRCD